MKRLLFIALFLPAVSFFAFGESEFRFNLGPEFAAPLGVRYFEPGFGASASLSWAMTTPLGWIPRAGLSMEGGFTGMTIADGSGFNIFEAAIGPLVRWRLADRFGLEARGNIGAYQYRWNDEQDTFLKAGGGLSVLFHLSPSVSLSASGAYTFYSVPGGSPINTAGIGLGISLNLSEILAPRTRIRGEKTEQEPVFPVSYAWYESNPVASIRVSNGEPNTIEDLRLSFFLERYMNAPSLFAEIPGLEPGEDLRLPVTALFNESILGLTETINANALILIEYRSLGARKQAELSLVMPIYHRNAMSWDDDRRAAAFVSSRDSAARLFARYTASVVDLMPPSDLPPNILYALGIFEALGAYGINYVIDPASSYIEMSENVSSPDSLNYPYQTLFYRGGDCDDLSILYCSMLEVLGIDTAFITIPGHIFMAFDTGIVSPDGEGGIPAALVPYLSNFIRAGGRLWAPVEITIPAGGFWRAVRVGGRQWLGAGEEARFYPMRDSWALYPPVNVPASGGQAPVLPDEPVLIRAVKEELDKLR
jgi:hypothetical protein